MSNNTDLFNEHEVKSLIENLLAEKERCRQERIAQKIGSIKDERTACRRGEGSC